MKLQKFENVDVIASLEAIMKQNTAFYQSDFDIDKQILRKAAVSLIPEDKRLLWFSRPSGTCCFRERDVFLKDTRQHNTWRFYGEQTRDTIIAYAVELTGTEQEKIKGNLYELDYLQHFREVIEKSIPADNYTLIYEHGERVQEAGRYFDGDTDPQLGKFIRFEAQPNDPEALKSLLREQQKKRTPHTQRDFQLHIAALHDRQIETEARRIVENVKGLGEPDSPEKTHCAVELSPYFVPLATDKDMERLLSMLPYKSLSLSTLEGRHGVYALIDKSRKSVTGNQIVEEERDETVPSLCPGAVTNRKIPKSPEKDSKIKTSRIGGMSMIRLTVEEMNLLSIYHEGSKAQLMENMTAALPFMDEDMRPFVERTLQKISPLTENEYAELAIFAADEV